MTTILVIGLLLVLQQEVASYTQATFFRDTNNESYTEETPDLDKVDFYRLKNSPKQISSFILRSGSCVELHENDPPTYETGKWKWTMTIEFNKNDYSNVFGNKIKTIKACGNYSKTINCPAGTFIKKILWDRTNLLRDGIEIQCYLVKSQIPHSILRSHGDASLTEYQEGNRIQSMNTYEDDRRKAIIDIHPLGRLPGTSAYKASYWWDCGGKNAISGLKMDIENLSGFIKSINILCARVEDIETECAAQDKRSILFICDASAALYPSKCTRPKKVGYGFTDSYSEELWREQRFYEDFGFKMAYAGTGLSDNFRSKLGYSQTTGYDWNTAPEGTFNEEITVSVEAQVACGCITHISEIIGDCSFMQVRPNLLERQDNCSGVLFTTVVPIPENITAGQVIVSKIPKNILGYLVFSKQEASDITGGGPFTKEVCRESLQAISGIQKFEGTNYLKLGLLILIMNIWVQSVQYRII